MAKRKGRGGKIVGTTPDHPDHPDAAEHILAIIEALEKLEADSAPQPSSLPALEKYLGRARGLSTRVYPWLKPYNALTDVIQQIEQEVEDDEEGEIEISYSDEDTALACAMPGNGRFFDIVFGLHVKNAKLCTKFINLIHLACDEGRQSFTNRCKLKGPSYLMQDRDQPLTTPIHDEDHKSRRGFNHVNCARALCPIQDLQEFDRDPTAYRQKVLSGEKVLTAKQFPSMLFAEGTVYDHEFPENGFGLGHYVLRLLNHHLVGPSGTFGGKPANSRDSNAVMWGVTRITPRIYASVVIQAYVSVSSMRSWGTVDGTVDLEALFENVLCLLQIEDDWTTATMQAINDAVPHLTYSAKGSRGKRALQVEKPDRPDPVDNILRQRELRRKQAQQERHEIDDARPPTQSANGDAPVAGSSNQQAKDKRRGQAESNARGPPKLRRAKALFHDDDQPKVKGKGKPSRVVHSDSDSEQLDDEPLTLDELSIDQPLALGAKKGVAQAAQLQAFAGRKVIGTSRVRSAEELDDDYLPELADILKPESKRRRLTRGRPSNEPQSKAQSGNAQQGPSNVQASSGAGAKAGFLVRVQRVQPASEGPEHHSRRRRRPTTSMSEMGV